MDLREDVPQTNKLKIITMKVLIEKGVRIPTPDMLSSFGLIVQTLSGAKDEKELKSAVEWLYSDSCMYGEHIKAHFDYGYGGSHFWLKESASNVRMIIVTYD